jgi:hypothetical protein
VSTHARRGFNRLFLVLTFGWVICCALIYPLWLQFDGQMKALSEWRAAPKNCAGSASSVAVCLDLAERNYKAAKESYSFKRFYQWDVALWWLLLPAIAVPPLAVYGLAVLAVWIWRGFKPRASGTDRKLP